MSFSEWREHYSSYDAPSMIAEAMTFPAEIPLNRLAGFLTRLVEVASNAPDLPYDERLKAAALAITTGQMLLRKADASGVRDQLEMALNATIEINKTYSLYPGVVGVIEEGTYDRQNPIGAMMAQLEPHEMSLLNRLAERNGAATISGNQDHRRFDRLERDGLIVRTSVSLDTIRYELTAAGVETIRRNQIP